MRDPPGPPSTALYTRESENQLCPIRESAPSQSTEHSVWILQFGGWPKLCECRMFFSACPALLTEAALSLREGRRHVVGW